MSAGGFIAACMERPTGKRDFARGAALHRKNRSSAANLRPFGAGLQPEGALAFAYRIGWPDSVFTTPALLYFL